MKNKVIFSFCCLVLLFSLVVAKAFYIQVINRDRLIAYSDSQLIRTFKTYPRRGYISDRNGEPLAINVRKYNLFAIPKEGVDIDDELRDLAKTVPQINFENIRKKVKTRNKYTWIARKIKLSDEQVDQIKKFKQVFIEAESSRLYPNHELASQILGFVGVDNEGLGGAEYFFNEKLRGQQVIQKYYRDAKGRPVKFKMTNDDPNARDIVLSIDKEIQAVLEKELKEGVIKHNALRGGAAVMDVSTGEIWAMANYPTFDPNTFRKSPLNQRKLSFITDPIEPGSIFKTLTIAAALENKVIRPDTNYYCERGKFRVQKHIISESDSSHAHEWLSVEDILKFSSNIGTTKIAFDLTFPELKNFLLKLNIGNKTNIEFPGESRGIFDKDKENVDPLRLSNISFGQGVATTGMQMLAAYAAFANGGVYIKPTLLKVDKKEDVEQRRVVSRETSEQITQMLLRAVDEGTGTKAQVPHFQIAGKTSTAQRPDENGGYKGYISGFIGYPVNVNKKFVVFVYIDNPMENGYYGGVVAAPIFQSIVKSILYKRKEYNHLASAELKAGKTKVDFVNLRQASSRIVGKGMAPNLLGLDKNSATSLLNKLKIKYKFNGFGVITNQYPMPGTPISMDTVLSLKFEPPQYE